MSGARALQRRVCLHAGGGPALQCQVTAQTGRLETDRRYRSHSPLCLAACQHFYGIEGIEEGTSVLRRDVKLENIFIAEDGRVRLGDFGLTMSMKQELAISPVGTVEYMAPEVPPPAAIHISLPCSYPSQMQLNGRSMPATLPTPPKACKGSMPSGVEMIGGQPPRRSLCLAGCGFAACRGSCEWSHQDLRHPRLQ